jgi:hypothetical protein
MLAMVLELCSGCTSSSQEWDSQRATADTVVVAAAAGDWSRVKELTRGDDAEARFEAMARNEPLLLRSASGQLKVIAGHHVGRDSSYVSFRFPYRDSTEVFDMGLAHESGRWIVYYVTLPKRM